jgi:hypothetical protein
VPNDVPAIVQGLEPERQQALVEGPCAFEAFPDLDNTERARIALEQLRGLIQRFGPFQVAAVFTRLGIDTPAEIEQFVTFGLATGGVDFFAECEVPANDPVSGQGTITRSMHWTLTVQAGRIPPGAIATVFIPTTRAVEFFDCAPTVAGTPTTCRGRTVGTGLTGGTVHVFANNRDVAPGRIRSPGLEALQVALAAATLALATTPPLLPPVFLPPAPPPLLAPPPPLVPPVVWLPPEAPPAPAAPEVPVIPEAPPEGLLVLALLGLAALAGWRRWARASPT